MGTNGLNPMEQLRERDKCKASPTKRQYHDSKEAWKAAGISSQRSGLEIIAYACPECGFFHLSKKKNGSDIAMTTADGKIVTPAMKAKLGSGVYTPPERVELPVDVSEIGWSPEFRRKMLRTHLEGIVASGENRAEPSELMEVLNLKSSSSLGKYMRAEGWEVSSHGRGAFWKPKGDAVNPVVDIKPKIVIEDLDAALARHPAGKAMSPKREAPVSAPQMLRMPLSNHNGVMRNLEIMVPGPLSEAEWKQMLGILEAMKPGLVSE